MHNVHVKLTHDLYSYHHYIPFTCESKSPLRVNDHVICSLSYNLNERMYRTCCHFDVAIEFKPKKQTTHVHVNHFEDLWRFNSE